MDPNCPHYTLCIYVSVTIPQRWCVAFCDTLLYGGCAYSGVVFKSNGLDACMILGVVSPHKKLLPAEIVACPSTSSWFLEARAELLAICFSQSKCPDFLPVDSWVRDPSSFYSVRRATLIYIFFPDNLSSWHSRQLVKTRLCIGSSRFPIGRPRP